MIKKRVLVVGAGIFGASTALALSDANYDVVLIDAGPIPHPLATSTDISKACRMEYGSDLVYMELMEEAFLGWDRWNKEWQEQGLAPLFHKAGILFLTTEPMSPGSFELDSFTALRTKNWNPQRLSPSLLKESFPAWSEGGFQDGLFNPQAGFAESSKVVRRLIEMAKRKGVEVLPNCPVKELMETEVAGKKKVTGARCSTGQSFEADEVILCTGVWTKRLCPELDQCFKISSHPVFHFKLPERHREFFSRERFPVFAADVTQTGVYGFPVIDGIIKIATHGLGQLVTPDSPREVSQSQHRTLRNFLKKSVPMLKDAELVESRLCFYCDTQDEDFWIARDPARAGLTVATGGSGHGFKFAPILGDIVLNVIDGQQSSWTKKFSWRPKLRQEMGNEEARAHNQE
ncbi:MAG: FAD-dependent oxidoreductase [Planctomycetota bacterium]|nr:FAD-dependent oxidoreductase [Planctomycetota bacterium]